MKTINEHKGFTLIELLISMAILGVVLASLTSLFVSQSRHHTAQNEILQMQGNARAAMEFVTRTIRGGSADAGAGGIRICNTLNGGICNPSINSGRIIENIILIENMGTSTHAFQLDGTNRTLDYRKDASGFVVLAENITGFRVIRNGSRIDITITAQTARPLPTTGRHGAITLTSSVYLRN
jgi:prepilin-type N-terminal cleavage/methylation domain-containing protein